jgi:hypothetical protein
MAAYSGSSYSTGSFNIYAYSFEGALYTGFKPVKDFSFGIKQKASNELQVHLSPKKLSLDLQQKVSKELKVNLKVQMSGEAILKHYT